jgi:hypothetical protein
MAPNLDRTIDFTKFTLGLAAAGFAYIAETAVKRHETYFKVFGVISLGCFAAAVVFGALVLGRATKIDSLEREETLLMMGRLHSLFLVLGLLVGAVLVFLRVVVQGE